MNDLSSMDSSTVVIGDSDVICVTRTNNEILRIDYFLEYYRKLGVSKFLIVDDGSLDGTREALLQQAVDHGDVHVFQSARTYKEARAGLDWMEELLDLYGDGHWAVHVDVDELLVYPDSENRNLHDLIGFIEAEGCDALFAPLLDMYPRGHLGQVAYRQGQPFLGSAPLFDVAHTTIPKLSNLLHRRSPNVTVVGGVRRRVFYPENEKPPIAARHLALQIYASICSAASRVGLRFHSPNLPPALEKIPLRKWTKGLSRFVTSHSTDRVRLSQVNGRLLHFKFLHDFVSNVELRIARNQHWNDSIEYKNYSRILSGDPGIIFESNQSVEYVDTIKLLSLGLLAAPKRWL
jgi:hypothetical protein